jgi:hypothetical protein
MKLKYFLSVVFIVLTCSKLQAQDVALAWVNNLGSVGSDKSSNQIVDKYGNVLIVGRFGGTIDFDPGPNISNLSASSGNGFILKLDPQGNFIWVKQITGAGAFISSVITFDNEGNLYVAGTFGGTLDFDPGATVENRTATTGEDAFVLKLDSSLNFIWFKQYYSVADWARPESIAVDTLGNVYVTGNFDGVVDFDPGTSVYNLSASSPSLSTFGDMYVQKLDSTGAFQWAIDYGTTSIDIGTHAIVDAAQNLLVAGSFTGTIDFDPGPGVSNLTMTGLNDVVFFKLNPTGNLIWAKRMGGNGRDYINAMKVDEMGNIYTSGTFAGMSADLDPGIPLLSIPNSQSGTADTYIQKLDSACNLIWVKVISGTGDQTGLDLAIDSAHNICVTGEFNHTADFNPGSDSTVLTVAGNYDIFILKLDSLGNFKFAKSFGGTGNDSGTSVSISGNSNVYLEGYFTDTVDFDPSPDTLDLYSTQSNRFLLKLTPCITTYGVDVQSACFNYTWIDGINYTSSNNTATYAISNATGCDSIVTLNLTINYTAFGIDSVTDCGPFTWIDGNTYSNSTTSPSITIPGGSVAGCDSIATLHLTIIDSAFSIDSYNECDALTWIDGNTYTSSNSSAFIVLPGASAQGCDSTVFLDLTIDQIDVSVTQTDQVTFMANASNATYQWLNCDNGYAPIVGETNQTFIASDNGNYAVEITNANNCSDTSVCYTVAGLSIQTANPFAGVSIYPNPTNGMVNIDHKNGQNLSISVYNTLGQIVFTKQNIKGGGTASFELTGAPGVYTVEVNIDGFKQNYKVVKE